MAWAALDQAWQRLKKASRVGEPVYAAVMRFDEQAGESLLAFRTNANTRKLFQSANGDPDDPNLVPPLFGSRNGSELLVLVDDLRDGEPVNPPPVLLRAALEVTSPRQGEMVIEAAWSVAIADLARLLRLTLATDRRSYRVRNHTENGVWAAIGAERNGVLGSRAVSIVERLDDRGLNVSDEDEARLLMHAQADMEVVRHQGTNYAILVKAPWKWCGTRDEHRSLGQPPGTSSECFAKGYRIALLKARSTSTRIRRRR